MTSIVYILLSLSLQTKTELSFLEKTIDVLLTKPYDVFR